jgi:hypothetical protein
VRCTTIDEQASKEQRDALIALDSGQHGGLYWEIFGAVCLKPTPTQDQGGKSLNRDHWGIESGSHQRLDVSHNDDRCRVRNHNAMWVLAMMRRLRNSLFIALAPTQTTSRPCHHH